MPSDVMRWAQTWSAEDHASFEALCFHRVEETAEPYSELMRAPRVNDKAWAEEIVKRVYEANKAEIEAANAEFEAGKPFGIDPETGEEIYRAGGEVFAQALGKACDGPGRVSSLISTLGPGLQLYECNTMHERGGLLNSYYSGPFSSGAVWDSFWFFEDAYGAESSVSFTTYHLTKNGLAYCLERWPDRVEELREREWV